MIFHNPAASLHKKFDLDRIFALSEGEARMLYDIRKLAKISQSAAADRLQEYVYNGLLTRPRAEVLADLAAEPSDGR